MKINTGKGDMGETDLIGGVRVSKASAPMRALGAVDELSAWLGEVLIRGDLAVVDQSIPVIQRQLFEIGALLASPDPEATQDRVAKVNLGPIDVQKLDEMIYVTSEQLPALKHFIFAGGTSKSTGLHVARAVCRRAEREVVAVAEQQSSELIQVAMIYLNRLGDLLFQFARLANHDAGLTEDQW